MPVISRYLLYLMIAGLTYAIGIYFSPKIPRRTNPAEVATVAIEPLVDSAKKELDDNFPTDEQFAIWQMNSLYPVIERWLKGENIDGKVIELHWNDGLDWASPGQQEARVTLLDVDGDGRKELALQTGCATVGNCQFFLFRRHAKGYQEILVADMVQQFYLRKSKSHALFDLETRSHGSSTSGGMAVYEFDGSEYEIAKCFEYEYERKGKYKNGQALTKDKPTLTSAPCANY